DVELLSAARLGHQDVERRDREEFSLPGIAQRHRAVPVQEAEQTAILCVTDAGAILQAMAQNAGSAEQSVEGNLEGINVHEPPPRGLRGGVYTGKGFVCQEERG